MVTLCPLTLPASFCASSFACRLLASSWTRRRSKSSSVRLVARSALPCGIRKLRAKPGLTFTTSPIWPSFGTRSRRMTCMAAMAFLPASAGDVGQEGQLAGALDRLRQLPLLLRRHGGDAPRHDLAALGDEALQQLHVLVVDLRRVGVRERARLAAPEEGAADGDVRRLGRPAALRPALAALAAIRARALGRHRLAPQPLSNRSRRPRSSRLDFACMTADGPSSSLSTRTVR